MKDSNAGIYSAEQITDLSLEQIKKLREKSRKSGNKTHVQRLAVHERSGPVPLSYAQERLWFLDQLGAVGAAYNVPMTLKLIGELKVVALERSLLELIRRHETLRTRFELIAGSPRQIVESPAALELKREELTAMSPYDQVSYVSKLSSDDALRPFDLGKGRLLRAILLTLSAREHVLLLTVHHIAFDGWSRAILQRELGELYEAYSQEKPSPLSELPVQYVDYASWQRTWLQAEVMRDHLQYWREQLLGAPPQLQLPMDRPRPAAESFKGAKVKFELPGALSTALKELGRIEGATLFMVALTAYQLLLSRWSGERDIVVGSPIAGRLNREVDGLIGFFVNMLVLRTDLSANVTFRQLLGQVKHTTLGAYAHQDLPVEALVKELRPERSLTRQPLFQVVLALENFPEVRHDWGELKWTWTRTESDVTHFDLTLFLREHADGLSGVFEYATDLFNESTVKRIARHFRTLLEGIVASPDCPIQQLPLLTEADRKQLEAFNNTAVSYPKERLVHNYFEAETEREPDTVAVVCADQQITYSQLNRQANRLAHALRAQGICPEQRVALFVERGVQWVVGVLAILKAGGSYVPLDVSYPAERLATMLEDSEPAVLLTQEQLKELLPTTRAKEILLDDHELDHQPDCNLDAEQLGLKPSHLAYVIYTSGSTGTPKGVMVDHRSLVNLIHWHCATFDVRRGSRCSSVASFGFDAATWEIWPPLSVGGTLVLASREETANAEQFLAWWSSQALDVSFLPTPMAELAFSQNIRNPTLRTLLVGGDRLRWRPASESFSLVNNYGPTESTVVASSGCIRDHDTVIHIGRPIANIEIYILDGHLRPVPIGVAGEIHIGGSGLARGYLNRAGLTAERFIANAFSSEPNARMYKSGDMARWREDGTVEYLARNDHQVKVRGYRIELGEIEAQLLGHPQVKEAAVLAHEDASGEKQLAAYVVADLSQQGSVRGGASEEAVAEVVAQWKTLYEETYSGDAVGPTFVGWNSSYTGEPIPEWEMNEWLTCGVERILALRPQRVLEIGCGVGLMLQHLAPQCSTYVAADFSASALDQVRCWLSTREDLKHVQLLHRSATEFQDLESGTFDVVILNSVVQYFPDMDYLIAVLRESVRLLATGGKVFVGDVRHLGLLSMFHSAVQLNKAAATVNVSQLRKRVARAVAQDKELVIDPAFFQMLPGTVPSISRATVQLKRGRASNELTRYRFDVLLDTGERKEDGVVCESLEWSAAVGSTEALEVALAERRWLAVRLFSIPNRRLFRDAEVQRLILTGDERLEAATLRRQLNELQAEGIDPDILWKMGDAHGYDVEIWPGEHGSMDVQLLDRSRASDVQKSSSPSVSIDKPWGAYANDPLESGVRQQFIAQLRDYLRERLPEYMIPWSLMVLKQLPLTANGKLNRNALPAPQGRSEELGEYIAPDTDVERALAKIWAEILRVDQVGIDDNFFELGGHSLLAVKALFRINQSLGSNLAVTDLYRRPTIRGLAARISGEAVEDSLIDLAREATLDDAITAAGPGLHRSSEKGVMLTGATGFVGRFLLDQLIRNTDARIYCLVRGKSELDALDRLKKALLKWDLWRDEFESRIIVIPGDLRLPGLGIDELTYQMLARNVGSIYHCATSMNHLETYVMAKRANVESARELLKLATLHSLKVVNYISTLGVFTGSSADSTRVVNEKSPIDGEKHWNSRGYVASKWVGEKIFMTANDRGIPCNIFRLGLVWADAQQGRFDELQNIYRVFKSAFISGIGIQNYQYELAPTPVDHVARAVVFLANRHCSGGGIFHISSPRQLAAGVFERCNEILDLSLEIMPMYQWICEIKRLHHEGVSLPVVPLVEFAFSMSEESFNEHQRRLLAVNPGFDCVETERELMEAGIVAPALNDNLLRVCVESMFSRDAELRELIEPELRGDARVTAGS